jgi:glycosyltransferase involved in cell wall biosynthesis
MRNYNLSKPNLSYLRAKDYHDLPRYLNHFDATIIPFKINKITRATSPLKLFEYMAGGKPIVITDMDECKSYKSVLVSRNKREFLKNLDKAIKLKNNKKYMDLLTKEAKENTWSKRVEEIIREL